MVLALFLESFSFPFTFKDTSEDNHGSLLGALSEGDFDEVVESSRPWEEEGGPLFT